MLSKKKSWVSGYTKKDGTVVAGYETNKSKTADSVKKIEARLDSKFGGASTGKDGPSFEKAVGKKSTSKKVKKRDTKKGKKNAKDVKDVYGRLDSKFGGASTGKDGPSFDDAVGKKSLINGSVTRSWVPGYTKADGTKVHGYESGRSKKQEDAKQPRQEKQEEVSGQQKFRQDAAELGEGIKQGQDVESAARDYDASDTGYKVPDSGDESFMKWSKDASPEDILMYATSQQDPPSDDDFTEAAASILAEIGDDDLVELAGWAKGIDGGDELIAAIQKAQDDDTNGKFDGEDLPNLKKISEILKGLAETGASETYKPPSEQDLEKTAKSNLEATKKWASEYSKESIDNRVSELYQPDITADTDGDGIADFSKVGVPAHVVPPPPAMTRMPNLTKAERYVESSFVDWFESDPDGAVSEYRRRTAEGLGDGPNFFSTDDVKLLHPVYASSLENRAKYNVPLHQTANAIAKRAFIDHLDQVVMNLPEDKRHVLVTAGGVAAGKGFALSKNKEINAVATAAAAVWDSAGEQNSTEMAWVANALKERGIKGTFVYVHADPSQKWENPAYGAVKRANTKGRMVDAHLYADSYVQGAENFQKFHENNLGNDDVNVVYIDSTTPDMAQSDTMPQSAMGLDRDSVYNRSVQFLLGSEHPDWIKRGGSLGMRVWGNPSSVTNSEAS